MDNEFNLPINCEKSDKCFKSIIVELDIYCSSGFNKNITNCRLDQIQ